MLEDFLSYLHHYFLEVLKQLQKKMAVQTKIDDSFVFVKCSEIHNHDMQIVTSQ